MRRFAFLVLLFMLVAFHSPPAEAYNGVLLSYPLVNPITIDGKWTNAQEWSDASQVRLLPATGYFAGNNSITSVDARICLKHDEKNLYILMDFSSDRSAGSGRNNPDSVFFLLDTLGNGGSTIREDDIVPWIQWTSNTTAVLNFLTYGQETEKGKPLWKFAGSPMHEASPPEGMQAAASFDTSNDQFSSIPHAIYEISIPRSIFKGAGDPGIQVHLQDHNSANPMDWKQTIFADFPYRGPKGREDPDHYTRIQFLKAPRFWEYSALSSLNPIQVDGMWTTRDEWADAVEETLVCVQGDGQAFMKAKFDTNMLYILADFLSDNTTDYYPTSGDPSGTYFSIDTHGDDGEIPGTDDYTLNVRWKTDKPEITVRQGTGSGWAEYQAPDPSLFVAASQFDGTNDPYSKQPHAVYEFAISRSLIGNSTNVTIRLSVWDRGSGTNLHWPPLRSFPSEAGVIKIVPPGVTVSTQSDRVEVLQGKSTTLPVTSTAINNFQGVVDLRVSISGQGLTASLSPQSVTMPMNGTQRVDLTIQADQNTSPGTYDLAVSAIGKGVTSSLGLRVEVKSAPVTPTTVQQTTLQTTAPLSTSAEQILGGTTALALIIAAVVVVALVMLARKRVRSRQSQ